MHNLFRLLTIFLMHKIQPFIKCIYCNLVAHSACYPPTSNVDTNGKFLCDVCTTFFHPEVNRKVRTKNPEDGNIPPPKPLAEDIEAKGDGRIHRAGIYCQLCKSLFLAYADFVHYIVFNGTHPQFRCTE